LTNRPPPSLSPQRARELVARIKGLKILIVGDVMLDRFIVGRVTRISPEAPVPVVQFQAEHCRLGGAANVAHNVAALGGAPSLIGVIGADAASERLVEQLNLAGIATDGLVRDAARPTTEKVRIVTERNQQVLRIDYERDAEIRGGIESGVIERVTVLGGGAKAVLVSDYLKGSITRSVIESLIAIGAPLLVDPKIPHLSSYAGATLITPNSHEAEVATHMRIRSADEARAAAREFRYRAQCASTLITRGEYGMWLSSDEAEVAIPATAREVADVTGAGDTVVATLALAIAAGATLVEAAVLANHAAGIVVGKFGPATVAPDELIATF
jgi:D-beta-D-heptose 7-phosphate kinase/D-beta-D-heptose 1-phosphate adenosyltransferase